MHSCGLRTGETRLLQPEHVHLRDGHIDIVSSKGNRSRRLPLTGEVTEVLTALRPGIPHAVRPVPAHVLRLGRRQPGHRRDRREDVQPHLGPGRTAPARGRPAAAAIRLPAPLRLRQHRAVDERRAETSPRCCPTWPGTWGTRPSKSTYYYIHTSPDFMDAYAQITRQSQSLLPEVGFE